MTVVMTYMLCVTYVSIMAAAARKLVNCAWLLPAEPHVHRFVAAAVLAVQQAAGDVARAPQRQPRGGGR